MLDVVYLICFIFVILFMCIIFFLKKRKTAIQEEKQKKFLITINNLKKIEAYNGSNLLDVLIKKNVPISSSCGGKAICARCKCKVFQLVNKILPDEKKHISDCEEKDHIRLACQVFVNQNININISKETFFIRSFTGAVLSNINVTPFIKHLKIIIDNEQQFMFQVGNYVQFNIPKGVYYFKDFNISKKYINDWKFLKLLNYKTLVSESIVRGYSLANSSGGGNKLEFLVRISLPPNNKKGIMPGLASSYIFSLKFGDNISFLGPYGDFLIKKTQREIVYIGGGAGMAPIRSHILYLFYKLKTKRKVTFFYGARSLKEVFFQNDFLRIEKKFKNFKYILGLSEVIDNKKWNGFIGYIHDIAYQKYIKQHGNPLEIEYYLCGPEVLINAAYQMLLKLGVEKKMIAFDKFS